MVPEVAYRSIGHIQQNMEVVVGLMIAVLEPHMIGAWEKEQLMEEGNSAAKMSPGEGTSLTSEV